MIDWQRSGDRVGCLLDLPRVHQILGADGRPEIQIVGLHVRHTRPLNRPRQVGIRHAAMRVRHDRAERTPAEAAVRVPPDASELGPEPRIKNLADRQIHRLIERFLNFAGIHQILGADGRPDIEVVRLDVRHARPLNGLSQIGSGRAVGRQRHRRHKRGQVAG